MLWPDLFQRGEQELSQVAQFLIITMLLLPLFAKNATTKHALYQAYCCIFGRERAWCVSKKAVAKPAKNTQHFYKYIR
jgi:hypothetical protein